MREALTGPHRIERYPVTRPFPALALALALPLLALPAGAETLTLASLPRAVTVYPSGAEVTR